MSEKDAGTGNPRESPTPPKTAASASPICCREPTTSLPRRSRRGLRRCLIPSPNRKTGYPGVYYPGVPDLTSASPISLSAGQQAEANFTLNEVPAYNISGTISGYAPGQSAMFSCATSPGARSLSPISSAQTMAASTSTECPPGFMC